MFALNHFAQSEIAAIGDDCRHPYVQLYQILIRSQRYHWREEVFCRRAEREGQDEQMITQTLVLDIGRRPQLYDLQHSAARARILLAGFN